jgi:hypothetical protein
MRPASRIVMFVHDPTGSGDLLPGQRVLDLLTAQTPIVWPDRSGPGRTLIYELDQRDVLAGAQRKVS